MTEPTPPARTLFAVTIVAPDYDEALAFYVGVLGFTLIEDTPMSAEKRWVVVAPNRAEGARILIARAANDAQRAAIGAQTGGRVAFFLHTDDFDRDYASWLAAGVDFIEEPRSEAFGRVAVFRDPFGNKWDLIEPMS